MAHQGTRPLEDLDAVEWSGPDGIAGQIRAFASEDDGARAEAYELFYSQILQPGSGAAAAEAAPFLIGLAVEQAVPQRAHLLELLNALSEVAAPASPLTGNLRAGAGAYAAVLADEDADVRLWATQLVARWPGEEKDAALAALRARVEKDEDDRVRANALLALALLGAPDRALAEAAFRAGEDRALERLAGAVALVSELKGEAPAEAFDHLISMIGGDPEALEAAEVLPALGDPWGTAAGALGRAPEALRDRALGAVVESFEKKQWATDEQAAGLIRAAFGGKATAEQLASPAPLQREALRAVARTALKDTGVAASIRVVMQEFGLPVEAQELRALAGMDQAPAAGEAPAGRKPWWKLW